MGREVPSIGDEPQPGGAPIGVGNPLSRDHSLLRRNLLGSLLDVVGVNLRHGTADVAVFEIGKGYARVGDEPREWWRLAFALVGAAEPAAWNRVHAPYDLDDAKGLIELLARQARARRGRPTRRSPTSPCSTRAARPAPAIAGRLEAIVGELHPAIVDAWELRTTGGSSSPRSRSRALPPGGSPPERAPRSAAFRRSTATSRSSSHEATPAAAVQEIVRANAGALLRDVDLFDIYRGIPLAPDEKSLAVRLRLGAPDRTLTEPDVDGAVAAVVAALSSIGGRIRT